MVKKRIKVSLMGLLVIAVILSSISAAFAANYVEPPTPTISSFTTSATDVNAGDSVVLKWDVKDAKKLELIGLEKVIEEDLPLNGELEVWPMLSTTYILNAYGENGSMTTSTVDVSVDAVSQAKIISFTSTAKQIKSGDTVKLNWQVQNAKSVEIIGLEKLQEEKEIPVLEGEMEVWPLATTTYVLQAVGFGGEVVSKAVTVTIVDNPVSVEAFTVNPTEITEGDTAKLSWKAPNAVKVNISGVEGDLPAEGTVDVKPEKAGTITYDITAIGEKGDKATASVSLVVIAKPTVKILDFKASTYEVSRGSIVRFNWTTENATGAMIVTNDGLKLLNRPANGGIALTPNVTREYTLIAYDANQNVVEKKITVVVK